MRVVFLEAPPSGFEQSHAWLLSKALGVPCISFGDLVRGHIRQGTELGTQAAEIMNSGRLVPDELMSAVVRDRLVSAADPGFVLIGHPRSAAQAASLDRLLLELGSPLDSVLHLRLTDDELDRQVARLTGRRVCRRQSAHVFEPSEEHPVVGAVCSDCGGELYHRAVDSESSVRGRFRSFEEMTEALARHYAKQELLVTVDVSGSPDDVVARALGALREHRSRPRPGSA